MIVSNDVVHDSRVLREGRALQSAGHGVTFLGWDRSGSLPALDAWDGMAIHRVRTDWSMGILRSDALRNPIWWRRAARLARKIPFDAVHCHDLDTLPIGDRLKRATGKPLVYDCHEVFGYMIEDDMPGAVVEYAFRLERRLATRADRVIAVNDMVKEYIDRVAGRSSILVRNCPETVLDAYRPPPGPPFTLLYIGTLHQSRFVLEAIDSIAELPNVRLRIGGSKRLTSVVRERCARHPNTTFLGEVPFERVIPMTVEAHAVLSMFDPAQRINQVGLPNKIFEAMAAGRPSIVTDGLPMGSIVAREQCGLGVPYTKEGLKGAVLRLEMDPVLAETLGRNGLAAAKREYNWAKEREKLVALYEDLGA